MMRAACLVLPIAMVFHANAQDETQRAERLKSSLLGIDTHIDTIQRVYYGHVDLGQRLADGQIDLVRLQEGGMHAPFFALWVPTYFKGAEAVRRTLDLRDSIQGVLDRYPDRIQLDAAYGAFFRIVLVGYHTERAGRHAGHPDVRFCLHLIWSLRAWPMLIGRNYRPAGWRH